MFRPIKSKKNSEEIIEQIKNLIVDGQLQPGDKLPSERDLAERLEVSRTSVREAFSALEIMGIISINPGEGSFVKQASYEGMLQHMAFLIQLEHEDAAYLYEVRKILEVEIAALAAQRATAADIEMLNEKIQNIVAEVENGAIGEIADTAYHLSIANIANNPILFTIMNTISDTMVNSLKSVRQKLFLIDDMHAKLTQQHLNIFNAIAQKDSQLARKRMRDHLEFVEKSLQFIKESNLKQVKEEPFWNSFENSETI